MSMKTKVGDVVRLDNTHWSYNGKLTAGHIGVVTALHPHSEFGMTWINIDGEDGAPYWNPEGAFTVLGSTGTLFEDMFDDMRDGDALVATDRNDNHLQVGTVYTALTNDCGCCYHFEDEDGDEFYHYDDDFYFINLSAVMRDNSNVVAFPTAVKTVDIEADPMFSLTTAAVVPIEPPKYNDLDDEAKGALLLAHHEGKPIQYLSTVWNEWYDDTSFDPSENFTYRVKPQELIDAEADVEKARDNVVSMSEARDAMQVDLDDAYAAYLDVANAMDTAHNAVNGAEVELDAANDRVAELRAA